MKESGIVNSFSLYCLCVVYKDDFFEHMIKVKDIKDDL